jgi:hypothetical protein
LYKHETFQAEEIYGKTNKRNFHCKRRNFTRTGATMVIKTEGSPKRRSYWWKFIPCSQLPNYHKFRKKEKKTLILN